MKCPHCKKNPISFLQFAFRLMPLKTICQHCETNLTGDIFLKTAYYGSLIFAVLFILRIVNLKEQFGWDYSIVFIGIAIFVPGIMFLIGGVAWKYGAYFQAKLK